MIDPIDLTKSFITFNTINPPGNEKALADNITSLFYTLNIEIDEHIFDEGRSGLLLKIKGERNEKLPLAFTGHLDTVPLSDSPWNHPPLHPYCLDDKIFGRGSSDMKSGLAACLAAVYNHHKILKTNYGAICILTACEELACQGAKKMAKDGILPAEIGPLIIAEPTGNRIHIGHKGVFWVKISFKGIAAHGSMPHEGENAIEKAMLFFNILKDKIQQIPHHPDFGNVSINMGKIEGGHGINLVADHCKIQLDIRLTPHVSCKNMQKIIEDCLLNFKGEYEILDAADSLYTSKENNDLQLFSTSAEKAGGDGKLYEPLTFFTDGSPLLSAMHSSAALVFGPGEAEQCHKVNEYAYISKIQKAYTIYSQFIKDYNNDSS